MYHKAATTQKSNQIQHTSMPSYIYAAVYGKKCLMNVRIKMRISAQASPKYHVSSSTGS